MQWTSTGQCSRGDSFGFEHDSDRRGTGKRSKSITFVTPQLLKVEGKRRHKGKVLEVQVRQAKLINHVASVIKKAQFQGESSCDYWHPAECAHYKTMNVCRSGDQCVFVHSGKAGRGRQRKWYCDFCTHANAMRREGRVSTIYAEKWEIQYQKAVQRKSECRFGLFDNVKPKDPRWALFNLECTQSKFSHG